MYKSDFYIIKQKEHSSGMLFLCVILSENNSVVAVAFAFKFPGDLVGGLTGYAGIDLDEVVDAGLVFADICCKLSFEACW